MATGTLFLNDRDVESDFSLIVTDIAGFPGMLNGAPRDITLSDGPEMSGGMLDPRLIRRRPGVATVSGIINAASISAAMTALDNLRATLANGEVSVRSCYGTDRYCLAICDKIDGQPEYKQSIDGRVVVSLSFTVKDGVAIRNVADGYTLTTTRVTCPIGTADSKPIITIHGGGVAMTNPTITVRNAAGDIVQTMAFTVSIGTTAALRVDCSRAQVSLVTAGVITDGLAAGYWTSGDFPLLRVYDGFPESSAYPSVELSSSTGTAQGLITYSRRYA